MAHYDDDFITINDWNACLSTANFNNGEIASIAQQTFDSKSCIRVNESVTGGCLVCYNINALYKDFLNGSISVKMRRRFDNSSNYGKIGFMYGAMWGGTQIEALYWLYDCRYSQMTQYQLGSRWTLGNSGVKVIAAHNANVWVTFEFTITRIASDNYSIRCRLYDELANLVYDQTMTATGADMGTKYGFVCPYEGGIVAYNYVDLIILNGDFLGGSVASVPHLSNWFINDVNPHV